MDKHFIAKELIRVASILLTGKKDKLDQKWFNKLMELEPKNGIFAGKPKSKKKTNKKKAFEFDTEEQLKEYLKDHPEADKSNHWVKKTEKKKEEKFKRVKRQPTILDYDKAFQEVEKDGKYGENISKETADKLKKEIASWEEEAYDNWSMATAAIEMAEEDEYGLGTMLHVVRGKDGELLGVCASRTRNASQYYEEVIKERDDYKPKEDFRKKDEAEYVHIDFIGTKKGTYGVGTLMIAKICDNLFGAGLELRAADWAVGYYRHLGMNEDDNYRMRDEDAVPGEEDQNSSLVRFHWSNKEAQKFGKQVIKEYETWHKEYTKSLSEPKNVKEEVKDKVGNLMELKKSLGEKGKDLTSDELLILFKTLSKRGYFDKGANKEEILNEALKEVK